jgi:hypothetical protein
LKLCDNQNGLKQYQESSKTNHIDNMHYRVKDGVDISWEV